jgi:hypothetical protein
VTAVAPAVGATKVPLAVIVRPDVVEVLGVLLADVLLSGVLLAAGVVLFAVLVQPAARAASTSNGNTAARRMSSTSVA